MKIICFNKKNFCILVICLGLLTFSNIVYAQLNHQKVKDEVDDIMSSREYSKNKTDFEKNIDSAMDNILDKIKKIFETDGKTMQKSEIKINPKYEKNISTGTNIAENLMLLVFIILCLIGVAFLIVKLVISRKRLIEIEQEEMEKFNEELSINVLTPKNEFVKIALEYYEKGEFAMAIRFLYMALLIHFNNRDYIKIDKSKTNRQYVNELRDNRFENFSMVEKFTHIFSGAVYGNESVTGKEFDYWYGCYNLLEKEENK